MVEPADPALFISGANTFDVAGESHKDYKLSLYALKPTTSKITITFKNPVTFEFVHYKIVSHKNNHITPDLTNITFLSSSLKK